MWVREGKPKGRLGRKSGTKSLPTISTICNIILYCNLLCVRVCVCVSHIATSASLCVCECNYIFVIINIIFSVWFSLSFSICCLLLLFMLQVHIGFPSFSNLLQTIIIVIKFKIFLCKNISVNNLISLLYLLCSSIYNIYIFIYVYHSYNQGLSFFVFHAQLLPFCFSICFFFF